MVQLGLRQMIQRVRQRGEEENMGEVTVLPGNPFWAESRFLNHILHYNNVKEEDGVVKKVLGYALLLASRQIDKRYNQRAGALFAISPLEDLLEHTKPSNGEEPIPYDFHLTEMGLEVLSIYDNERMSEFLRNIYELGQRGIDFMAIGIVNNRRSYNSRDYKPGDVLGTRLELIADPNVAYEQILDERVGMKHRAGGRFSTYGADVIIVSQAYPGVVTHYRGGKIVKRYKPQVSESEWELAVALWSLPEGLPNASLTNYINGHFPKVGEQTLE